VEKKASSKKPTPKAAKQGKEDADGDDEGLSSDNLTPTGVTDFFTPKKSPDQLKIASWNVAGWQSVIGKGFAEYVKNEDPDIICVQEHKLNPGGTPAEFLQGYHSHFVCCTGKKGYSGVALFSKVKPLQWVDGIGSSEHDPEGRCLTAEFENFYLVTTYIPNSGKNLVTLDKRMAWDKLFLEYMKKLDSKKPVIWCGDLNVAHLEIDLTNPKPNRNKTAGFTDQERDAMTSLLKAGFVDTYRHLYPAKEGVYSYWSYFRGARHKNIGWRLDYFIISKSILDKLGDSYMRSHIMGSDHCPIVLHIALK